MKQIKHAVVQRAGHCVEKKVKLNNEFSKEIFLYLINGIVSYIRNAMKGTADYWGKTFFLSSHEPKKTWSTKRTSSMVINFYMFNTKTHTNIHTRAHIYEKEGTIIILSKNNPLFTILFKFFLYISFPSSARMIMVLHNSQFCKFLLIISLQER